MHVQEMLASHPGARGNATEFLVLAIEACADCGQACVACADACLAEDVGPKLRQCIRLNLDCADVCAATGALASRAATGDGTLLKALLEACGLACRLCADTCLRHAHVHEHCGICAGCCRRCERACWDAATTLTPP